GLANFLALDRGGRWTAAVLGGACYYPIRDLPRNLHTKKHARYLLDWPFAPGYKREKLNWIDRAYTAAGRDRGWASVWFHWMANESPWAHVFLTKDWKTAFKGGVVYHMDYQPEIVLSAMCGIRYIGESPFIPKMFVRALKYSQDNPMIALLAAHNGLAEDKNSVISCQFQFGHAMFYMGSFNPRTQMDNWRNGKLITDGTSLLKEWDWKDNIKIFGRGYRSVDEGYGLADKGVLKLPDTAPKKDTDIFGNHFFEPGALPTKEWMKLFTEEVNKYGTRRA
ncbi:MAG: hypothetical protein MN733_37805, partial [Nitrososphaera sp.]|nr:hypothetical protein [Nitrososphaera sp.]